MCGHGALSYRWNACGGAEGSRGEDGVDGGCSEGVGRETAYAVALLNACSSYCEAVGRYGVQQDVLQHVCGVLASFRGVSSARVCAGALDVSGCGGSVDAGSNEVGRESVGSSGQFSCSNIAADESEVERHVGGGERDAVGNVEAQRQFGGDSVGDNAVGIERRDSKLEAGVGFNGQGPHYARNRRWRAQKKSRGADKRGSCVERSGLYGTSWRVDSGSGGAGHGVASSTGGGSSSDDIASKCWTINESEAGKAVRLAVEKKNLVEAEVATRRAQLNLERLNDKTLTDLYNARLKQESIGRMNQATSLSEKSLAQLKSVSPGSSATPGEIRKALLEAEDWKVKEKKIFDWVAAGEPKGVVAGILNGGKETETSSMDTEMKELCAEYGCGPDFADEVAAEQAALLEQEKAYEAKAGERAAVADARSRKYLNYVLGRSINEGFKCSDHLADWEVAMLAEMEKEKAAGL